METQTEQLPEIGIVGPGLVGRKLIDCFYEDGVAQVANVTRVFASERSAGEVISLPDKELTIELASEADYSELFAVCDTAPAGFASEHGERIAGQATLITASSDLRKDPDVPLIIPEINPQAVVIARAKKNILAKSNCTTTIGSLAIYALHNAAGLRSLSVNTYQSTSGQGWPGIREFRRQASEMIIRNEELIHGQINPYPPSTIFPERPAFNVAPKAGTFEGDDTTEELKYKNETRKIFGLNEDVAIDVTCARVSTFNGHAVDIHAEFDDELAVVEARELLAEAESVQQYLGDEVPQPIFVAGTNPVHVGRVRQSERFGKRGVRLWAVGDNLTVGAAHNIFKTVKLLASQSK